jgi:hypothetical protein
VHPLACLAAVMAPVLAAAPRAAAPAGEWASPVGRIRIAAVNRSVTAEGVDGDGDLASIRATGAYRALRDRM